MQHPFLALKPEYTALLSQMRITRLPEVDAVVQGLDARRGRGLLDFIDAGRYAFGCNVTGVPQAVAAASFEREASSNFSLNPAQGWPLTSRSRDVPYNGPFADWTTAQIAAYKIDGLDKIGAANWSWEMACYMEEAFNGFGPRNHGKHSGYLWAGTNIYTGGKYVADNDWNPNAVDTQLGVIPMMLRIVQIRPALALPLPFPGASMAQTSPDFVVAPPAPAPEGLHSAATLQTLLNKLGAAPPLVVDGNYGRGTRRAVMAFQAKAGLAVDGLAGPATWAAIDAALAAPAA